MKIPPATVGHPHARCMPVPRSPAPLLKALCEHAAEDRPASGSIAGSLAATAALARAWGFEAQLLPDHSGADPRQMAAEHARRVHGVLAGAPDRKPCILLSGGAAMAAPQDGGPDRSHGVYLLALALQLEGVHAYWAMACRVAADGVGAMVWPDSIWRARQWGFDPPALLEGGDACALFSRLGDLVVSGPACGDAFDFRGILIM